MRGGSDVFEASFGAKTFVVRLAQETKRYKELIKTPMDLSMVKKKLEAKAPGSESYIVPEGFVADVRLIFSNCAKYYKVPV